MANRVGHWLNHAKKLLLASAGIAALAGPVAIGVSHAPAARAQARVADAPMDSPLPATTTAPEPPSQATAPQPGTVKPAAEKPAAFDAASIKPNDSVVGGLWGWPVLPPF